MENEETVYFHFTDDQQEIVAKYFDKDIKELEFFQVCELLDEVINDLVGK